MFRVRDIARLVCGATALVGGASLAKPAAAENDRASVICSDDAFDQVVAYGEGWCDAKGQPYGGSDFYCDPGPEDWHVVQVYCY
jgi:hypothetical protein